MPRFQVMGDRLWRSVQGGESFAATAWAREMCDILELVLAGIGWGRDGASVKLSLGAGETILLTTRLGLDSWSRDLSKDERDDVYGAIRGRLAEMGDLWLLVDRGDFQEADRLARQFLDLLQLALDGMGWGPQGVTYQVGLPDKTVRRIFGYLHETTARARVAQGYCSAGVPGDVKEAVAKADLVLDVCRRVNTQIDVRAMHAESDDITGVAR